MSVLASSLMHAYLKDLVTGEILRFGYVPEEIEDSKSANYAPTDIPGRSEPIMGYINSSAREFNLRLTFMAGVGQLKHVNITPMYQPGTALPVEDDDATFVKLKVDWLRSLLYPDYSNVNYVQPPHRVLLSIGGLIKSVCIVMSVNTTYKMPWDENLLPYIAEAGMVLQEVNTIPRGYSDVRYSGQ